MDLIVWYDDEDKPVSFQLAYDKHRWIEGVIRWNSAHGYSHHRVDEGRGQEGGPSAGSALLIPGGTFDAPRIRSRFLALSPGIPWAVTEYVADRLREHPEHKWRNGFRGTLAVAALFAIPLGVCLLYLRLTRARGSDRLPE